MNNVLKKLSEYTGSNQLQKAHQLINASLASNPDDLDLLKYRAYTFGLQGKYFEAIQILEKQYKKFPDDFDINNNLSFYYANLDQADLSIGFATKSKKLDATLPQPYLNTSYALTTKRDFENALLEVEKCIEINQKIHSTNYDLYMSAIIQKIHLLIAVKKKNEAVDFIQDLLKERFLPELFFQLVDLDNNNIPHKYVEECIALTNQKKFLSSLEKYQKLSALYFSLALYYQGKNQDKSEEYYLLANKEINDIQRYNLAKSQKTQKKIYTTFNAIKEIKIDDQFKGAKNIFIVGLPRCGSTLTESIIAANNKVFAIGESKFMRNALNLSLVDTFNQTVVETNQIENIKNDLIKIGNKYINQINELTPLEQSVDKQLSNIHYLGFIKKALPSSKIIILLRDPWDVAISMFKQRYVVNVPYSSSFFNIGVVVSNFEASFLTWKKFNLIENVMVINYEDLVNNQKEKREEIYTFCQIDADYDDEKRSNFFAKTASMKQVQSAVHKKSIKKQEFLQKKGEFVDALESQRNYWRSQGLEIPSDYLGYSLK